MSGLGVCVCVCVALGCVVLGHVAGQYGVGSVLVYGVGSVLVLVSLLLRQVGVSKLSDKAAERVRVAVIYAVLFIYFLDYLFIYSL